MSVLGYHIHHPTLTLSISVICSLVASVAIYTTLVKQPVIPITPRDDTGQSSLGVTSQDNVTVDKPLSPGPVIEAVNADRAKHNLSPLTEDPRLDNSATQKATELARYGFKDNPHINSSTGRHGYTYALDAAHCSFAAENISFNNNTTQSTVNAWINSPEHHAAMDGNYQSAGVGIEGTTVVLHLCRN